MMVTEVLTVVNVGLLLSLLYVYAKNYAKMKSGFTAGLALFAGLFLLQNLVSLFFLVTMMPYFVDEVEAIMPVMTVLQTLAFIVMNWLTWK